MPLPDKAGFTARVALATALVMSIITGVGWMLIRPPLPGLAAADATTGQKPIFGPKASWMLLVGAVPGDERAVTVSISARDVQGQPILSPSPPRARARLVDIPAALEERVDLVADGPGSWRGAARLSAAGRWALDVELNGETVSLPFESAPATR
jgi:hypothetical protein